MAKADVLDAVSSDLANGRTQPALQRLGSLVATHPTDLDLRRRLASVHRLVGNPIEAGRWDYLHADADPAEIGAFERAFPSPAVRLRKLRWPARDAHAATEFARNRLAGLTDEAVAADTIAADTDAADVAALTADAAADAALTADADSADHAVIAGHVLGTERAASAALARVLAHPRPIALLRRRYALIAGLVSTPFAALGAVTVIQWIVG